MAGRYYSPLDYAGAMSVAQAGVPDIMGILDRNRQRAIQEAQLGIQSAQEQRLTADAQAKAARVAQYQQELAALNQDPSPEKTAAFMMRWPEFSQEVGAASKIATDAKSKANVERVGEVAFAIDSNPQLAISMLEERIAADAKAGQEPDPISGQVLEALKSGDPAKVKEAKAAVNVMLAKAMGAKEYYTALTGGEPGSFEEKLGVFERKAPDLARTFLETEAQGQLSPYYDPTGQHLIGAVRLSDLPRVGGNAPANAPAPGRAGGGEEVPLPKEWGGGTGIEDKDPTTKLRRLTSDRWPSGTYVYLVNSEQDYAKVPEGARYLSTHDRQARTKPRSGGGR